MKTKALYLAWVCLLSGALFAQSPRVHENPHHNGWVLPSGISFPNAPRRGRTKVNQNIPSCNNNGICEPWLGDSCTTCPECVGDPGCAHTADVCSRYNFSGGNNGTVHDQCLNGAYSYLVYFLDFFSQKYAVPGSNIVSDTSPLTPGDGKCNQYISGTTCGGFPTESCYNDPQDCGPCPTIANVTNPNEAVGTCDPTQCAQGVCTAGQCSTSSACQYNCDSAHYGGASPNNGTHQSDAVDFAVDATSCSALGTSSDSICNGGANFISYGLDIPNTLHVSVSTLVGSFTSVPDSTGVTPVACPSPTGGPPSFRAWLAGSAINSTLFTVGGGTCNTCTGFGGSEVRTVEAYDTTSGAWYTKFALQTARFGLAAAAANGKVYALGGTNGSQSSPVPSVEEYDPGADLWSAKTTMPTPRWKLTASTVNGVIYAIGGGATGNQCTPTGVVEAYDPVADTWNTNRKPMPTARWGAAADVLGGQIYVVGGSLQCPATSVIVSAELQAYDPTVDSWTVLAPMLTPRWDLAAAAVNGKLYAIGGWDPINQTALDVVEEFNPGTNSWATKTPMPTKRSGLTAVAINGKIYAFGGIDPFNRFLNTLEIYDPTIDKWTTASQPPPTNPPSITFISPTSGNQGQTVSNFTVVGSNFDPSVVLSFSGTGLTPKTPYTSVTSTQIITDLTIASNAPVGTQDVVVTNPDGQKGTRLSGFAVTSRLAITSVYPGSGIPGQVIGNFTVLGSNFDPDSTLSFSGTGITVAGYVLRTTTKLVAQLTIGSASAAGAQDVIITNPNSSKGILNGGFNINISTGFLTFPLMSKTAFNASISAVMDHHIPLDTAGNPLFYSPDNLIDAFTGDEGTSTCTAVPPCIEPNAQKSGLLGYKSNSGGSFALTLPSYTGGLGCAAQCDLWLFYDGHTGYDYPAPIGTDVYAPASGIAFIPDCDPVIRGSDCSGNSPGTAVDGFNILVVDHGNGYSSWFLHMGNLASIKKEQWSIPGSSYQVTVAHAPQFQADQGVLYADTLKKLTAVPKTPTSGHYSVDQTKGVYTFAASDMGRGVLISYLYYAADFHVITCPGTVPVVLHRGDGQRIPVTPTCTIGKTGNKAVTRNNLPLVLGFHLHFEVRKGLFKTSDGSYKCRLPACAPTDPYGWTGAPGSDPYPSQLGSNLLLWK
jgi:N-acetylneuraminic acid mutarotase